MSITEKRLDEIRERLDAATPGPWMPDNDEPGYVIAPDDPSGWDGYLIARTVDHDGGLFVQEHNAELIAHAPQDLADLLAEVGRLRGELAKAREITEDKVERAKRAFGAATAATSSIPLGMSENTFIQGISIQHGYAIRIALQIAMGGGGDA